MISIALPDYRPRAASPADLPALLQGPPGRPPLGQAPGGLARVLAAVPPPGLVLLSIVAIQLGAVLAIGLFPTLGPATTVFLRLALSAALLVAASRRSITRAALRHAGPLLLFGGTIGAMNLVFYEAIARIPLGVAVSIEFVGPLAVAVATSRRARDFLWIGLAVAGLSLLSPEFGDALDRLGVLFAVLAGVGWAAFILLSKRIGTALPGGSGLALGMAVASVSVLPFALASGGLAGLGAGELGRALAVALLSTTIPFSFEFEALKRMPPRAYGILVTLEPAVAVLAGLVALAQPPAPMTLVAVACVTAAALGVTVAERRDPPV